MDSLELEAEWEENWDRGEEDLEEGDAVASEYAIDVDPDADMINLEVSDPNI